MLVRIADHESIVKNSEAKLAEVKKSDRRKVPEMDKLDEKRKEHRTSVVKVPASSCDAAVQADYSSATEGPVMDELASTVLEITGGKHQSIKWPGNGFRLTVSSRAVPKATTISLAVRAFLAAITRNIESLVTWVLDEYIRGGWTRHHAHMLQYEEASAEGSNPSISFRITETANDKEKNWKVTIVSAIPFEKSVVDQLTEKHNLPFTRFGIEWKGSSFTPRSSAARRIELFRMKGPYNHFTIFLPQKALKPDRNKEASITSIAVPPSIVMVTQSTLPEGCVCKGKCVFSDIPTATLDTLPDGRLGSDHLSVVLLFIEDRRLVARWKKIGIMLDLPYADMEVIKRNQPDEEERLMAMLNQWLTSGRATKQALVATLQRL